MKRLTVLRYAHARGPGDRETYLTADCLAIVQQPGHSVLNFLNRRAVLMAGSETGPHKRGAC